MTFLLLSYLQRCHRRKVRMTQLFYLPNSQFETSRTSNTQSTVMHCRSRHYSASCISYIGPGLLYLGINGEEFLSKISGSIESWRRKKGYSTSSSSGDANNHGSDGGSLTADDLPVEGDADAQLPPQNDVSPTARSYETIRAGPKPCWYYLGLFPCWCAIARKGATHMNKKIDAAIAAAGRGGIAVGADAVPDDGAVDVLPTPSKVSLHFQCCDKCIVNSQANAFCIDWLLKVLTMMHLFTFR